MLGPNFKNSLEQLELCTHYLSPVRTSSGDGPSIKDLLKAVSIVEPVVFKSKNIGFRDVGPNLNFVGDMVRSVSSKRED
jgi:hypothetical protein